MGLLKQDIRPGYLHAPDRVFGVSFAGMNIKFTVNNNVLTVCAIAKL
ncbi:MAG: hypothetical protein KBG90_04850 [Lachnospira sp.]|nr:hypothetical protein [Lachnospira sp.]